MSRVVEIRVPDLGDFDQVDVVEVLVAVGDTVAVEQSLITLESDKASMEVPSTHAGVVTALQVQTGDKIGKAAPILTLEVAETSAGSDSTVAASDKAATAPPSETAPASETASPPNAATTGDAVHAQVVVLGSGPGGYSAAFRAADLGLDVVLVERYPTLGGVCLNVGCIPSKALLHVAKVIDEVAVLNEHGVSYGAPSFDLPKIVDWKQKVVDRLVGGVATMAKQRQVTVVEGVGRFTSPHSLAVTTADGERTVSFDHAIVAVGSQATKIPGFPYDDPRLLDSTSALELAEVPERLLVIGGGIIGLEMATVYHALGARITVAELLDGIMPGADRDIVRRLERWIKKRYENIFVKTRVTGIEARREGLEVFFDGEGAPASDTFGGVLLSVGRRPNGKNIAAEAAGLEVDQAGFIPVDKQMRSNVAHIFAIGDVAGQPMLAHKATHEGKVAAEVIAGKKTTFDARAIPSVAYTDPEVAWVGLTEEEAKRKGIAYEKGSFPWSANGRSLALGRDEGLTKILFDKETERILGAGIVGPNAGDLISEVGLAIEMGCDAHDIGLTIHPHPTLSETVAMSSEAFAGTLTDLYLPKQNVSKRK